MVRIGAGFLDRTHCSRILSGAKFKSSGPPKHPACNLPPGANDTSAYTPSALKLPPQSDPILHTVC
jgi:hypothetical protein